MDNNVKLTYISNIILFSILDNLDIANIKKVVFYVNSFNIEELLDTNDKDYVIFHKGTDMCYHENHLKLNSTISNRLKVWDESTYEKPIHKDWFMTILYYG